MKRFTCKGGKIRFKLGNETKEYYAVDIEVIATTGDIKEDSCEDCVNNKKPEKEKRKPKKTSIKVQKVELDLEKGDDGSGRTKDTDIR